MAILHLPITSVRIALSGVEIALGQGEHVVGRGAECSLCIDDALASRRHAAITITAENASIRDLGSRNGVLVNGDEIDGDRVLVRGDLITLGSQAMSVVQIRRGDLHPRSHDAVPIARIALLRGTGEAAAGLVRRSGDAAPKSTVPRLPVVPMADDGLDERRRAATTHGGSVQFSRPLAAFRLIAEAAQAAVEAQRPERAEKILEAPLHEVLTALRAGKHVEPQILDSAASQATMLYELTRRRCWADYVRDLFDQQKLAVPGALADRLAPAMR